MTAPGRFIATPLAAGFVGGHTPSPPQRRHPRRRQHQAFFSATTSHPTWTAAGGIIRDRSDALRHRLFFATVDDGEKNEPQLENTSSSWDDQLVDDDMERCYQRPTQYSSPRRRRHGATGPSTAHQVTD
ncbi:MAG: hypothetical protein ACKPB4_27760, partial [Sphaerospermopsis kisseleviana]